MKKFYNEPKMNISLFMVENVVTGSGEIPPVVVETAEDKANEVLNTAGVNQVISLTF